MIPKELLDEALDWAALHGVLRTRSDGSLTHVPFALTPASIPADLLEDLERLTETFHQLMVSVAAQPELLREQLEPSAETDSFLAMLLKWLPERPVQPLHLLLQRNDFFLVPGSSGRLQARQVELNTISASFPFLAGRMYEIHQLLLREDPAALLRLVRNHPLPGMAAGIVEAFGEYDVPEASLLMIVQPNEGNRFDQRGLEEHLLQQHGIPTLRRSLEQVAEEGRLQEGHLMLGNAVAAVTYFRAAYTPDDFPSEASRKGRELIEASSTIQCPSLAMQLAGMKKIQQVLTDPDLLSTLIPGQASEIQSCFAQLHALDALVPWEGETIQARDLALRTPERFVLKPQREGGGNNFFADALVRKLRELPRHEEASYILMERLRPHEHTSTLIVERQAETLNCVSEIGIYGSCLAEQGRTLFSQHAGHLVRTKAATTDEGGVAAGYACLNSLMREP